ncbi:hypothetical protein NKDENANG_00931 [Candidatus Entotheonellaceae bacterium PAL068K]
MQLSNAFPPGNDTRAEPSGTALEWIVLDDRRIFGGQNVPTHYDTIHGLRHQAPERYHPGGTDLERRIVLCRQWLYTDLHAATIGLWCRSAPGRFIHTGLRGLTRNTQTPLSVAPAPRSALPAAIDPVRFEVLRNALLAITEKMGAMLRRAAYSTNIKTRGDFSCAFFDSQLRTIAQAFAQPSHLGSLAHIVPHAMREYGVNNLEPGDGILINDPYLGGVHLNDMTLITPVFEQQRFLSSMLISAFSFTEAVAALRPLMQEGGGRLAPRREV